MSTPAIVPLPAPPDDVILGGTGFEDYQDVPAPRPPDFSPIPDHVQHTPASAERLQPWQKAEALKADKPLFSFADAKHAIIDPTRPAVSRYGLNLPAAAYDLAKEHLSRLAVDVEDHLADASNRQDLVGAVAGTLHQGWRTAHGLADALGRQFLPEEGAQLGEWTLGAAVPRGLPGNVVKKAAEEAVEKVAQEARLLPERPALEMVQGEAGVFETKNLNKEGAKVLAEKFVNLHNAAAKEYKQAFKDQGYHMWHDDDAHLLKQDSRDFIAEKMEGKSLKQAQAQQYIVKPLTVLDAFPNVTRKEYADLDRAVDKIHQKYHDLWQKELVRGEGGAFEAKAPDFGAIPGHVEQQAVMSKPSVSLNESVRVAAERLGVDFNGMQEGLEGKHPGLAIFTDRETGTSVGVRRDELTPAKLEEHVTAARERMKSEGEGEGEVKNPLTERTKLPKILKTGVPIDVDVFHVGRGEFVHNEKGRGSWFSHQPLLNSTATGDDATWENNFGDDVDKASIHFDNPLVARDPEFSAKKLGLRDIAETIHDGVDAVELEDFDLQIAEQARNAGYDGIVYTDHFDKIGDSRAKTQYVVLSNKSIKKIEPIGPRTSNVKSGEKIPETVAEQKITPTHIDESTRAAAERLGVDFSGMDKNTSDLAIFTDRETGTSVGVWRDELTPAKLEQNVARVRERMTKPEPGEEPGAKAAAQKGKAREVAVLGKEAVQEPGETGAVTRIDDRRALLAVHDEIKGNKARTGFGNLNRVSEGRLDPNAGEKLYRAQASSLEFLRARTEAALPGGTEADLLVKAREKLDQAEAHFANYENGREAELGKAIEKQESALFYIHAAIDKPALAERVLGAERPAPRLPADILAGKAQKALGSEVAKPVSTPSGVKITGFSPETQNELASTIARLPGNKKGLRVKAEPGSGSARYHRGTIFIDPENPEMVEHEVGHHIYDHLDAVDKKLWNEHSGGQKSKLPGVYNEDEHFATVYEYIASEGGTAALKRQEPKTHEIMQQLLDKEKPALKAVPHTDLRTGDTFLDEKGKPRRVVEVAGRTIKTANGGPRTYRGAVKVLGGLNSERSKIAQGGKLHLPAKEPTLVDKPTYSNLEDRVDPETNWSYKKLARKLYSSEVKNLKIHRGFNVKVNDPIFRLKAGDTAELGPNHFSENATGFNSADEYIDHAKSGVMLHVSGDLRGFFATGLNTDMGEVISGGNYRIIRTQDVGRVRHIYLEQVAPLQEPMKGIVAKKTASRILAGKGAKK